MKNFKIIALLVIAQFVFAHNVYSQDIIKKRNGVEISAKVLKVNTNDIEYTLFGTSHPLYVLAKSEILTIAYENGNVDEFQSQPNAALSAAYSPALEAEFYAIGTNDRAMLRFLQQHDEQLYQSFYKACKQRRTGKTLLATGLISSIVGVSAGVAGILSGNEGLSSTGMLVGTIGEGLIIASIPVSVSAGIRKKNIKENFARKHFDTANLTFGFTSGGIGITLNF
ncbi:MAG: hypothetical protein LBS01_09095 [Prevotellaceae bacterium]|jgi:hypothetical protein|nr:hypothetical protein [Prevotellaceae bacterium]